MISIIFKRPQVCHLLDAVGGGAGAKPLARMLATGFSSVLDKLVYREGSFWRIGKQLKQSFVLLLLQTKTPLSPKLQDCKSVCKHGLTAANHAAPASVAREGSRVGQIAELS